MPCTTTRSAYIDLLTTALAGSVASAGNHTISGAACSPSGAVTYVDNTWVGCSSGFSIDTGTSVELKSGNVVFTGEVKMTGGSQTNRPDDPTGGAAGSRDQLLVAARRCIATSGLAGATSRQITASAGANLASITYHFASKDELIAEALFSELERRIRPALACFDQPGDPTMQLVQSMQQLLTEFERSKADAPVYLEALLLATADTTADTTRP